VKILTKALIALSLVALVVSCAVRFEGHTFPEAVKVVTPFGHGSGVVIREGVLTAEHVISSLREGGEDYYVLVDGRSFSSNSYVRRGTDGKNDRAILNVDVGILPAKVYCGPLLLGQPVIHAGYPSISGTTTKYVTYGRINSVDIGGEGTHSNMVGLDISADAGSSGGPVFNMKGEVIGIVIAVGRGHHGAMWTTLMALPPPEICIQPEDLTEAP